MGPPSDVCGFINHYNPYENYSYIYHKATYVRQLSYLGGPILYGFIQFIDILLDLWINEPWI